MTGTKASIDMPDKKPDPKSNDPEAIAGAQKAAVEAEKVAKAESNKAAADKAAAEEAELAALEAQQKAKEARDILAEERAAFEAEKAKLAEERLAAQQRADEAMKQKEKLEEEAAQAERDRLELMKKLPPTPDQVQADNARRQALIRQNIESAQNVSATMLATGFCRLIPPKNGAHYSKMLRDADGNPAMDESGQAMYAYADARGDTLEDDVYLGESTDPALGSKEALKEAAGAA